MTRKSTSHSKSRRLLAVCGAAFLACASLPAASQQAAWPNKPIRLVVGFAPGGGTDVLARAWAGLTEALGPPSSSTTSPAPAATSAPAKWSRAAPDGYTLLVAPTSVETANPYLFKSNVLPSRDLTPVMGIGRMQMYVVAKPTIEAKDVKDLVALAKSQPGKLNYASSGTATPPHLAGELFKQSTGTFVTHVPYRGSAPPCRT